MSILTLFFLGCYEPSGGIRSPLPGLDGGTQLCGAALPCPEGELCHPSGVCIPCPGGSCGNREDGEVSPPDSSVRDGGTTSVEMGLNDAAPADAMISDAESTTDQGSAPDRCVPSVELCNGLDDDCDDLMDEDFDLSGDADNCGQCGHRCADVLVHATSQCVGSTCELIACSPGWTDADGDASNGCEVSQMTFEISTPEADAVFTNDFSVQVTMLGIESVGHVEVTANGEFLGRRAPPAELIFPLVASQYPDGQITLRAEVVDLAGQVIASDETTVLLDRTPPTIRFLAPEEGLIIGTDPIEIRLEVSDQDTEVAVELLADGERLAFQDAPPFVFTLLPREIGAGPRVLRAVATDRGGHAGAAQRQIRLSFCSVDEMVAIPDMPVLIDAYENSRPDANEDDAGLDNRVSCSQPGVLPWSAADFVDAEGACNASGKRICTPEEWVRACGNIAIDRFPYGNIFNMQTCNGVENPDSDGIMPTGSHEDCVAGSGAFDLSGNLAEWTDEDIQRFGVYGGHYLSEGADLTCQSVLFIPRLRRNPTLGFRCCRDI